MKVTKIMQKEYLRDQLSTNDTWAKIALMRIMDNQTEDEQNCDATIVQNGIGFTGTDARILSSFASQLQDKKYLSPKQMNILKPKMKKYWKQILCISDVEKLNKQIIEKINK